MNLVAAIQMNSTGDKSANLDKAEHLIKEAAKAGAKLASLPENFAFFGTGDEDTIAQAEPLDGKSITRLKSLAQKNHIWLSLGGFQEQIAEEKKIYNSHLLIDAQGDLVAVYRKIHLFLANLPEGTYDEARMFKAGNRASSIKTPFFVAGLAICFDLRFPCLFNNLREQGAEVFLIPAAFTKATGPAHWEVLLRARAIENQCYVIAAAQVGQNNAKRATHGHAMIVDPWGRVIARCDEHDELALAEIDLNLLKKIREQMPLRPQIFS